MTKIPLNAQHRSASGVAAGDEVDVEIVVDTGPREVALPAELQSALRGEPEAAAFFTSLSTTNQSCSPLGSRAPRRPRPANVG